MDSVYSRELRIDRPGARYSFCHEDFRYSLVPRDSDLDPSYPGPRVCAACFETFYGVLEHLPDDGSEGDVLLLRADQDCAVRTVETLLGCLTPASEKDD